MFEISEEQKILLENLRRVVKDKIAPVAGEIDREGMFNWDTVSLFWDIGLLQIMLPEAYGGWPHNPCHTLCLSIEEISKACASSALLLVIQAVGSFPIISAANQQQKENYFPRISRGRELIAYLVSEPGAGSDVQAVSCTAKRSSESYVLNGRKVFATNGAVAGLYSVLARSGDRELSFFVVDRNQDGITIGRVEDKCGFRGSNTSEVILEDVVVSKESMLGKQGDGFAIAMADFDMSRPTVAALALGIAEGALQYALEYALNRTAFGKTLVEHQAIQFMLADASTQIEAGRGLMERAALMHDAGKPNTGVASMSKCFCSDASMKITTDMVQILGGYGYTKDYPLERMFRDAKLTQIFEGTNQIQRMIIGKEMVKRGKAIDNT